MNLSAVVRVILQWFLLFRLNTAFLNNPKIIIKDGNLIIESGLNRNITFHINGTSQLNINNEWNLIDLLRRVSGTKGPVNAEENSVSEQILSIHEMVIAHIQIKRQMIGYQQTIQILQNRTTSNNVALPVQRRYLTNLEEKLKAIKEQLETDNCKSGPCQNGGTCSSIYNGFVCRCTQNFEGNLCERDINECALFAGTNLGCQNGGECINQFGGYTCICMTGWFGIHCTQRKDCSQSSSWELCGHGTCVNTNNAQQSYKCICDQGWTSNQLSPACLIDVDECSEAHPQCVTRCINLPGSFMCAPCPPGLTGNGMNCRDVDECAINNGGCSTEPTVSCINTHGSYKCGECPLGWSGDGRVCTRNSNTDENSGFGISKCASEQNVCHPRAKCTEVSNTVVCTCPAGMVGSGYGVNGCVPRTKITCDALPCLNGGTCLNSDDVVGYMCLCLEGYYQPNCTTGTDPCARGPCANNGVCKVIDDMTFRCDCMPGFSGRQCQTQSPTTCGGVLNGVSGMLKFPPADNIYNHNAQCAWVIRTNTTRVLNVTFDYFELENSTECRFDWLQINDGRSAASQIIGRFCDTHKPLGGNIISSTNYLYLWFRSDASNAKAGFLLRWNSIPPQCGGPIEFTTHGTIASPGSPGNYPKNRDCRWKISTPNNKRIKLIFFNLQIENHTDCNHDYVEITDDISNNLIEKFCKSSQPQPMLLPTNEITIHFHSDNAGSDAGFQIYYSAEERIPGCGGTYTARTGVIKSPNLNVPSGVSCEYDIKMIEGESIIIDILDIQLKTANDCLELYDVDTVKELEMLLSKYCGGYDFKPVQLQSLYNMIRIKYYNSDGTFELRYRADCSYIYTNSRGVIKSPNYPNLVEVIDRTCTYTIRAPLGATIALEVQDFELNTKTDTSTCEDTYLKINDEIKSLSDASFCGNNTPHGSLWSNVNSMQLIFKSSSNTIGRGFLVEYRIINDMTNSQCGGIYTESGHTIRLPTASDGQYENGLKCKWLIIAPRNMGISLNWKSFNLEISIDCSYDYVAIYDSLANSDQEKPLAKYCDDKLPPASITFSHLLLIEFSSDISEGSEGFEVSYDFVDAAKQCGGIIHTSAGVLLSPYYPSNYTNELDCIWIITVPLGMQLELRVDMFELEESPQCTNDWLEIRNGGTEKSPLVGVFCGTDILHMIPSFTNELRLHFHTDKFLTARGFKIEWYIFSNGCGGNLISNQGTITSPNFPNPYPNNAQCEWLIQVKKGSNIELIVEEMDVEVLSDCYYDKLLIYEGRSDAVLAAELCNLPDNQPRRIQIAGTEALIRFRTDWNGVGRGFLLSYHSICSHIISDLIGTIESPNLGDPDYRGSINCAWTIVAPKGNRIMLEVVNFGNIRSNAIYIIESTDVGSLNTNNRSHVITKRQRFNSTSDVITVLQNSTRVFFRLDYKMVGCVEYLTSTNGTFQSPNYPRTYTNNMECLWEISTPPGNGIELTIEDLDIEESTNCTNDALIISIHKRSTNPKERHCGKSNTDLVIKSGNHRLFVRFFSDGQRNGKGFYAHYRIVPLSCGGELKTHNGVIESPNYPIPYPTDLSCEWYVVVSEGHTITLTLEDLDIESGYGCEYDYVEAYEYDTEIGMENEKQLFSICGQVVEKSQWTTRSNVARIVFVSDDTVQSKGFKLSYQENCGQRFMLEDLDEGNLQVTKLGNSSQICTWHLITKSPNIHVTLTITHVQLNPLMSLLYQTEANCTDRGVKIYDGVDDKAPLREKFCMSHPSVLVSNGHAFTITVPFDTISEFEASYTTQKNFCSTNNYYSSLQGKLASPSYPSTYPVNIECTWIIEASSGNAMVLTIETMSLEYSSDCNKDYLEVRDNNETGGLLGIFCGENLPTQEIKGQRIWLKFRSDDDQVGQGFLVSYNYVQHNELKGTEGTIESPHYPSVIHFANAYSWRITVNSDSAVLLTIKHIVDEDIPFIKFYDGYTNIGSPIPYASSHIVRSYTNLLYITSIRGPFQFEWRAVSKEELVDNNIREQALKDCGVKDIYANDNGFSISSPGYPYGYKTDLNCTWNIIPIDKSRHVVMKFTTIDLEELNDCRTDYVKISSSNDLQHWKTLGNFCKKTNDMAKKFSGTPFLKIDFITDASINMTGFSASVETVCGSEMWGPNGIVNITSQNREPCIWSLHVRQGRRIRIHFIDVNFPTDNHCNSYLLLRNGIAEDSPMLGRGKYCENNITEKSFETSSNSAFVKLVNVGGITPPTVRLTFSYEEMEHECSDEIYLDALNRVRTISSPKYPNLPNPHTECIWRVTVPPNHIVAIDFVDKFELGDKSNCSIEYVELNDGASELMPLLGHYCGTKRPDTVYSSGNVMYIKYFNDLSIPHIGFIANVSIGLCGGLYFQNSGVIQSPKHLIIRKDQEKTFECVYTIELERGQTINLTIDNIDFPDYTHNCSEGPHLELQEIDRKNGEDVVTDTLYLCAGDGGRRFIVETNKLVVHYKIRGERNPNDYFQFSYTAISDRCGDSIVASRGVLQTPQYPESHERRIYCRWQLTVPKGRRVKVEFLDCNSHIDEKPNLLFFYNDFEHNSLITTVRTPSNSPIYSTDNTMVIEILAYRLSSGCKLRFSSNEENHICNVPDNTGKLHISYENDMSVYCRYYANVGSMETLVVRVLEYERERLKLTCEMDVAVFFELENGEKFVPDVLCKYINNLTNISSLKVLIPYPVTIALITNSRNKANLKLNYERKMCGGVMSLDHNNSVIIKKPQSIANQIMECAWFITKSNDASNWNEMNIQVNVSTNFTQKCEEQYVIVYNGKNQNAPVLGHYCNQSFAANSVPSPSLFIEYYSAVYEMDSKFKITVTNGIECGGTLNTPFRDIYYLYPYERNLECIWDINVRPGFSLSLSFRDRFFIESSINCTKDYILIQKNVDDEWRDLKRLCGREIPAAINSTSSMRIIFRSDNDTSGDGFLAHIEEFCGGVFYSSDTVENISSPAIKGMRCVYEFRQQKDDEGNAGVEVKLTIRNMEFISHMPSCYFGETTITTWDNDVEYTDKFKICDKADSFDFHAKKRIVIEFSTKPYFELDSNIIIYRNYRCGGLITNSTVIRSPRFYDTGGFPHNSACYWNLTAPEGYKIVLKFEHLDFESSWECSSDAVEVFRGLAPAQDARLMKLCGNFTNKQLPYINIPTNKGLVYSYSDYGDVSFGFSAIVNFVFNCDNHIYLNENNGSYNFDKYASPYSNNLDCTIIFTTDKQRQIQLNIYKFDLENSTDCSKDFVEIRDGSGAFADLIGKFCGQDAPRVNMMSSSNAIYIRFVSDGQNTGGGFGISFSTIPLACGHRNIILDGNDNTVITSPMHSNGKYLKNLNCVWLLKSSISESHIHIHLNKIDLQPPNTNGSCTGDILKFYTNSTTEYQDNGFDSELILNGAYTSIHSNLIDNEVYTFCGNKAPTDLYFSQSTVYVKFQTDATDERSGFSAIANVGFKFFKNFTGIQGRINVQQSTQPIDVYIIAPNSSYTLSLYYTVLTFYGNGCNESYIEVFDAYTNTSLQKICTLAEPAKNLFSNTSALRLIYNMGGFYSQLDVTYLASRDGPGCGGDFHTTSGSLTSAFYPRHVREYSNCRWNINMPNNLHVLLYFTEFNMGAKSTCHTDYLQIIEHYANNTERVAVQYCGDDTPERFRAQSDHISIYFHKTNNFDGIGWALNFYGIPSNTETDSSLYYFG